MVLEIDNKRDIERYPDSVTLASLFGMADVESVEVDWNGKMHRVDYHYEHWPSGGDMFLLRKANKIQFDATYRHYFYVTPYDEKLGGYAEPLVYDDELEDYMDPLVFTDQDTINMQIEMIENGVDFNEAALQPILEVFPDDLRILVEKELMRLTTFDKI